MDSQRLLGFSVEGCGRVQTFDIGPELPFTAPQRHAYPKGGSFFSSPLRPRVTAARIFANAPNGRRACERYPDYRGSPSSMQGMAGHEARARELLEGSRVSEANYEEPMVSDH